MSYFWHLSTRSSFSHCLMDGQICFAVTIAVKQIIPTPSGAKQPLLDCALRFCGSHLDRLQHNGLSLSPVAGTFLSLNQG